MTLNYVRIALAALGAFIAYFVIGGLTFGLLPVLRNEFLKYPAVYRSQEGSKSVMPAGMVAMFVAMVVLAVIYAMLYRGGSGLTKGAHFGALIGVFAICSFVVHNYVNLNIGLKLTMQQGVAYFIEWLVVGMVIGLIYKPLAAAARWSDSRSRWPQFVQSKRRHSPLSERQANSVRGREFSPGTRTENMNDADCRFRGRRRRRFLHLRVSCPRSADSQGLATLS